MKELRKDMNLYLFTLLIVDPVIENNNNNNNNNKTL